MSRSIFHKYLPLVLLSLFIVCALILTFEQVHRYDYITTDSYMQDKYGQTSLAWYKTGGKDQSFLTYFPPESFMPEHGPVVETIIAEVQHKFGHPEYTRALMVGLMGLAGVLGMALCGFELGGWWGALLAALGLWLYPRFIGTVFNNSKDIPFTSTMVFVLWAVLLLTKQWGSKWRYMFHSCLVGFLIGFAISIRVNAILWLPMLGCLPVGWWLIYGRRAFKNKMVLQNLIKQVYVASIILLVTFITIYLCWPYIALDPLPHFYQSIIVNSKYPWDGVITFNGSGYHASKLPRTYILSWLWIGSPPAVVFLGLAGVLIVGWRLIKRQGIELQIAVVALSLFFPLIALLVLHPVLYDAMRQFLFLVPSLILFAVYGFLQLFDYLQQRKQKIVSIALVLVIVISQIWVVKDMADLYPYEYLYFSPLVGGFAGNAGRYQMDYEALCIKPAADWLASHYKQYTIQAKPSVTTSVGSGFFTLYYTTTFTPSTATSNPDFYIYFAPSNPDPTLPNYKPIHTISTEGYPLCVVKTR